MQSYKEFIKTAAEGETKWYNDVQNWMKENPEITAGGAAALTSIPLYLLGRGFGKKRDRMLGLLTALVGGGAAYYGMKNWGVPWLAGLGQSNSGTNTTVTQNAGKTVAPPRSEAEQDAANAGREARGQRKSLVTLRYDENNKPVFRGLEPAKKRTRPWFFSSRSYLDRLNAENSRPISQEVQEYANALRKERGQKEAPITTGYTQNGRAIIKQ